MRQKTHADSSHAPVDAQKNSDITLAEIEAKLTGEISTHSHALTKANVGLDNVDNTSDADKPISTVQQTALDGKQDTLGYTPEDTANKGVANGYAELDATGKVPSAQLPSFVDDVIESADFASLPATGESGKIYVTLDDNKSFRWGGSVYVEIASSLALGETETTAYRGDYGKIAYEHSQADHAPADAEANAVDSVAGKTGVVTLNTDDITEGTTNKYSPWKKSGGDIEYLNGNVQIGDVKQTVTPVRSDYEYNTNLGYEHVGFRFQPLRDGYLTELAGYDSYGENGTIYLFDFSDGSVITSTSITFGLGWVTQSITPVRLYSNKVYVISKFIPDHLGNNSHYGVSFPIESEHINIIRGHYGSTSAMPQSSSTHTYGLVDFTYETIEGNLSVAAKLLLPNIVENITDNILHINTSTGEISSGVAPIVVKPDWDAEAGSDAEILNKPDLLNVDDTAYGLSWDSDTNAPSKNAVYNKIESLTASDVGAEAAFTKNTAFNKDFGTASGTICQGNDSRLSDPRTPTEGSVSPSKLDDEFKTVVALGASVNIDWSTGQVFTKALTSDPVYTFSNLHIGVKFIETTGDYSPTFPSGFVYAGGTRSSSGTTLYQIICTDTSVPKGYYSIIKEQA